MLSSSSALTSTCCKIIRDKAYIYVLDQVTTYDVIIPVFMPFKVAVADGVSSTDLDYEKEIMKMAEFSKVHPNNHVKGNQG